MFCLREEVDRLEGAGAVAVAGEQGDIAREGIRPAADIDDTRRGAMAATAAMHSGVLPARGGSSRTTSGRRPSAAARRIQGVASAQAKRAFLMPLCAALARASCTAAGVCSTP